MKSMLTKTLLAAIAASLSISAAYATAFNSGIAMTDTDSVVSRNHDKAEGPWPKDNSKD